jgi:hypothetical protein
MAGIPQDIREKAYPQDVEGTYERAFPEEMKKAFETGAALAR